MVNATCRYSLACSPLTYWKCPSRSPPVRRSRSTTSSCVGTRCIESFSVACSRRPAGPRLRRRSMFAIMLFLKFVQAAQIVGQNFPVARRQALVVRRFLNGVDHIVQDAVVPAAMIQIGLKLAEFPLGPRQALAFPVGRAAGPDVIQIGSYFGEQVGSPALSAETLVALVIPILRGSAPGQHAKQNAPSKDPAHERSSRTIIPERRPCR